MTQFLKESLSEVGPFVLMATSVAVIYATLVVLFG